LHYLHLTLLLLLVVVGQQGLLLLLLLPLLQESLARLLSLVLKDPQGLPAQPHLLSCAGNTHYPRAAAAAAESSGMT
jgi:hypothetical protein